MSMWKASARRAMALPMRAEAENADALAPHLVRERSAGPASSRPARTMRSNIAVLRTVARSSDHAASATHSAAASGELVTAMPSARAASTSMPS